MTFLKEEKNATYIKIEFRKPTENPSCVEGYYVTFKSNATFSGDEITLKLPPNAQSAEMGGLEPCVTYFVDVETLNTINYFHKNIRTEDASKY